MEAYSFCALPLELIVMVADYLGPLDLLNLIQGLPHIAPLLNSWHIQAHDENGHTILHHIVEQRLEYLIKPLAKWIPRSSIADNEGWTPLFQAVRNSDESMTKALVYAGADVSAKDHTGKTALHLACYEDAVGIVQILLDHGANPSAADCNGRTPLHDAFGRNTVILQKLIKAGADLNPRRMPRGLAPLYLEAWLGREDAVRILLEAGADPSIQTETGETILQKAIEGSHTKVVQLLLDAGVDINMTVFDCSRGLGQMFSQWITVDVTHCIGRLWGGRLLTVKLLLKEGVDSSAEDNRGYTPQRYAVEGVYTHGGSSDIDWEEPIRILEDVHTKSPFLRILNWMRAKCYLTKKS
ncbi:hypothetical protein HCH54_006213 [Aspergillus fumigatus]